MKWDERAWIALGVWAFVFALCIGVAHALDSTRPQRRELESRRAARRGGAPAPKGAEGAGAAPPPPKRRKKRVD